MEKLDCTLSELYAGGIGNYLGNYSNNTTYFAHNDQVGTRRRYTGPSGNIVETCTFLPFGDGESCTGSATGSPTAFTGPDWDPNTNLTRFPMRNYSTQQGRWMHPDPAGLAVADPTNPQSWNRYAYVNNSPVSFIDPLGLTNDCGGPCTAFSYSDGTCTVDVTYDQGTGDDGNSYDMPSFNYHCDYPINPRGPTQIVPLGTRGNHPNPRPPANSVTAAPSTPQNQVQKVTASCLGARLADNFVGPTGIGTLTVALHVVAAAALEPAAASFIPGPSTTVRPPA